MGKSFVYNTGSADDDKKDDELRLTFGIFIDGTLNNKDNTQLRRHSRKETENSIISKKKKDDDKKREHADYKKIKSGKPVHIPDGFKAIQEYKEYLEGVDRSWMDEMGTENSYSNDYTNVARMWSYCNEEYAIYVEGMGTSVSDGTSHNRRDSQDGFAFGSGTSGIRARVRLACERVAKHIQDAKKDNSNSKVTQITFDVFGFSRGAASARNFVHEVNTKREYEVKSITIPDGYYPPKPHSTREELPQRKYRNALGDSDGLEIDPKGLVDGKLPRFGHLGYSLLMNTDITPDDLIDIKIIVRFIGIYDTVSSYYERGALGAYDDLGNLQDDNNYVKLATFSAGDFENDEKELGLQELELKGDASKFQKMVHFTAQDEHRKNFALTRINQIPDRAIEKNLPGVHCDIGGAYENEDEETIDEIGTSVKDNGYTSKTLKWKKPVGFPYSMLPEPSKWGLEALKQDLIDEYWYDKDELQIHLDWGYTRLEGKRKVKKEYSYIPLHFMEEFCRQTTMKEYITLPIAPKYPLGNSFLEEVKEHLHEYVFEDAPEWKFKNDAQLDKEKYDAEEKIKEATKIKEAEKELEKQIANRDLMKMPTDNLDPDKYRPKIQDKILIELELSTEVKPTELEEVVVYGYSKQKALRKLRHEYLHWSSHRDWFGMEPPSDNRKREFFPKT